MKLFALFKKKKPEIRWHNYPAQPGWYRGLIKKISGQKDGA